MDNGGWTDIWGTLVSDRINDNIGITSVCMDRLSFIYLQEGKKKRKRQGKCTPREEDKRKDNPLQISE